VVSADWLKTGQYEMEVMGKKYPAKLHLRSPFDPKNKRLQGDYSEQKAEN
jgi:sarcosine dehydrogenase